MLLKLILFIPKALYAWLFAHGRNTEETRKQADRIITGMQPATEKQIISCITKLQTANRRLRTKNETDTNRIRRLRIMLGQMMTPHG